MARGASVSGTQIFRTSAPSSEALHNHVLIQHRLGRVRLRGIALSPRPAFAFALTGLPLTSVNSRPPQPTKGATLDETLRGAHVELRPVRPADFEYLYELELQGATTARWRFRGVTPNPEVYPRTLFENVTATFVVCVQGGIQRIGIVSCYNADLRNQVAYLAALADPSASKSILVVEAVAVLADYCFAIWAFRKLYLESPQFALDSFASSANSILHEEARLKNHHYYNGEYFDQVILALYRAEWVQYRTRVVSLPLPASPAGEISFPIFVSLPSIEVQSRPDFGRPWITARRGPWSRFARPAGDDC